MGGFEEALAHVFHSDAVALLFNEFIEGPTVGLFWLLPLPRESRETKLDAWDHRSLLLPAVVAGGLEGLFAVTCWPMGAIGDIFWAFIVAGGERAGAALTLEGAGAKLSSPSKSNKSLL